MLSSLVRRLKRLPELTRLVWRSSPRLRRSLWILLAVEFAAVVVAPAVLPRSVYLDAYLNDERAALSVTSFFNGQGFLAPDSAAGWVNRPNISQKSWNTDAHGARSHEQVAVERNGKHRMLLIGSSKINGGTGVAEHETISAYLANRDLETINFGTMLYGADQAYIAYSEHYSHFDPDIVVLGLDATPDEPLANMYVPLRRRSEVLMPYVKPRFELVDGNLNRIDPPLDLLRNALTKPDPLLDFLAERDGFFGTFEDFQRFGFTPLAYGVNLVLNNVKKFNLYLLEEPTDRELLLLSLLQSFHDELVTENKRLVLVLLPDADTVRAERDWAPALHRHQRLVKLLRDRRLQVVDTRDALRANGGGFLFHADSVHYTAAGNRVIAQEIAHHIANSTDRVQLGHVTPLP